MLFYFTATGNCLSAARALDPEPVSIPHAIHGDRSFSDDAIGIVAPVYGHEMPAMVKDFIRGSRFDTDYFFLILTYGCRHGNATELAERFCRECGVEPAYIRTLLTVDNWLPNFDMAEEVRMDKGTDANLRSIAADLASRRRWIEPSTDADREAHRQFLGYMAAQAPDAWQHLVQVTGPCTGCGICSRVCPSGSMALADGRARFTPGSCQTCLACIHACPHGAITLTIPERNPGARYRNPDVTLEDIIASNDQTGSEGRC